MRSSLLIGFLAALSAPAYSLQFRDAISQDVHGHSLYLLHDGAEVKIGHSCESDDKGWLFDTAGFADDEAVMSPLADPSATLLCEEGSNCRLDFGGYKKPYQITRVDDKKPIFTFTDIETCLYLSRTDDQHLALTSEMSDSVFFTLHKIKESVSVPLVLSRMIC